MYYVELKLDLMDSARMVKGEKTICQGEYDCSRRYGEWIDEPVYRQTMDGKTWDGFTFCSECKQMNEYGYRSKFCPNCGARMKGYDDGKQL